MKKITTFLMMLLVFQGIIEAQSNIRLNRAKDNVSVKVEYTELPARPLTEDYVTYSVSVSDTSGVLTKAGIKATELAESFFNLDGYLRISSIDSSDFHINVSFGDLKIISANNLKRKVAKGGDSEEMVTTHLKLINYNLPIDYMIVDYLGNEIENENLLRGLICHSYGDPSGSVSAPIKLIPRGGPLKLGKKKGKVVKKIVSRQLGDHIVGDISTTRFYSKKDLEMDFKANYDYIISNLALKTIEARMKILDSYLKYHYDFEKKNEVSEFFKLSGSSPGVTEFNKALYQVRKAFKKMKADEPIDKIKEEIQPAIDQWLALIKNYPIKKKNGRMGRYACHYNIANAYFWVEDFEKAKLHIEMGRDLKSVSKRKLTKLSDKIDLVEREMKQFNVTSRHINRNLKFEQFEIDDAGTAKREAIDNLENISFDGFIIDKDGNRVKGEFVIQGSEMKNLEFGKDGNIKFNWQKENVPLVSYLSPEHVQAFGFNQRNFKIQNYRTADDTERKNILECIFESEKIKVFKSYSYGNKSNPNEVEIALQRKSDASPVSTLSTEFSNFDEGLAAFFKDCENIQKTIKNGEFKNSELDLVSAAKFYRECK